MSDVGFPKESSAGVGEVGVAVRNNVVPRTDEVELSLPGICISTASGQVAVLTTDEEKK